MAPPPTLDHPLDNVAWSALTTRHAAFAEGGGLAWRYGAPYAKFAAVATPPAPAWRELDALARIVRPGEEISLLLPRDADCGPHFELVVHKDLVQMLGPESMPAPAIDAPRFAALGPEHATRMADLVRRTEPGPWMARTHELGRFLGVFDGDALVAMAGERMYLTGYREISAVCTDPAWRGRGLARDLMLAIAQGIVARGERPFLHVMAGNAGAIALYERLGFVQRARLRIHALRRRDTAAASA